MDSFVRWTGKVATAGHVQIAIFEEGLERQATQCRLLTLDPHYSAARTSACLVYPQVLAEQIEAVLVGGVIPLGVGTALLTDRAIGGLSWTAHRPSTRKENHYTTRLKPSTLNGVPLTRPLARSLPHSLTWSVRLAVVDRLDTETLTLVCGVGVSDGAARFTMERKL